MTRDQKLRELIRSGKSHKQIRQIMAHFDSSSERVKAIARDKAEWQNRDDKKMYFDQER